MENVITQDFVKIINDSYKEIIDYHKQVSKNVDKNEKLLSQFKLQFDEDKNLRLHFDYYKNKDGKEYQNDLKNDLIKEGFFDASSLNIDKLNEVNTLIENSTNVAIEELVEQINDIFSEGNLNENDVEFIHEVGESNHYLQQIDKTLENLNFFFKDDFMDLMNKQASKKDDSTDDEDESKFKKLLNHLKENIKTPESILGAILALLPYLNKLKKGYDNLVKSTTELISDFTGLSKEIEINQKWNKDWNKSFDENLKNSKKIGDEYIKAMQSGDKEKLKDISKKTKQQYVATMAQSDAVLMKHREKYVDKNLFGADVNVSAVMQPQIDAYAKKFMTFKSEAEAKKWYMDEIEKSKLTPGQKIIARSMFQDYTDTLKGYKEKTEQWSQKEMEYRMLSLANKTKKLNIEQKKRLEQLRKETQAEAKQKEMDNFTLVAKKLGFTDETLSDDTSKFDNELNEFGIKNKDKYDYEKALKNKNIKKMKELENKYETPNKLENSKDKQKSQNNVITSNKVFNSKQSIIIENNNNVFGQKGLMN